MRRTLVIALAALAAIIGLAAGPAGASAPRTAGCGTVVDQYTGTAFTGTLTWQTPSWAVGTVELDSTFTGAPSFGADTHMPLYWGSGAATLLAAGGVDWISDGIYAVDGWVASFHLHTTSVACRNGVVGHLSGTFTETDLGGYSYTGVFDLAR